MSSTDPGDAPHDAGHRLHVVALVASAGGLEQLTAVLGALPSDFPAAVLVAMHKSPERRSLLAALLDERCVLPVEHVADGQPLDVGRVLVIPPGFHALVLPDETMSLFEVGAPPPSRPSGDLLLTSMATALGDRATAVVLSGYGHDGATGATAIHHLGGRVIAASESSSDVPSMPRATALRDDAVDQVQHVGDIAGALAELLSAARAPG